MLYKNIYNNTFNLALVNMDMLLSCYFVNLSFNFLHYQNTLYILFTLLNKAFTIFFMFFCISVMLSMPKKICYMAICTVRDCMFIWFITRYLTCSKYCTLMQLVYFNYFIGNYYCINLYKLVMCTCIFFILYIIFI